MKNMHMNIFRKHLLTIAKNYRKSFLTVSIILEYRNGKLFAVYKEYITHKKLLKKQKHRDKSKG